MFAPLVDVFGDQEVVRLFSEESLVAAWLEFERALADWAHWARRRVEEGFIGSPD